MLMLGEHSSDDNDLGANSPPRTNLLDLENGNIKPREDSEEEYLDEENINLWFIFIYLYFKRP